MTATHAATGAASGHDTLILHGWELHFTGNGSDKYYIVLVVDTLNIISWGRRGTNGQVRVYRYGSQSAAINHARKMTNEKEDKGYRLTHDYTTAEVTSEMVQNAPHDATASRALVRIFRASPEHVDGANR